MKARIIKRIWIVALGGIVAALQTYLAGKVPDEIITYATSGVALLGTWALTAWLGNDAASLQEWLADLGLYEGKPSGIIGERTIEAVKQAVNDDDVTAQGPPGKIIVKRAKPIDEPHTVARPPWSKMH